LNQAYVEFQVPAATLEVAVAALRGPSLAGKLAAPLPKVVVINLAGIQRNETLALFARAELVVVGHLPGAARAPIEVTLLDLTPFLLFLFFTEVSCFDVLFDLHRHFFSVQTYL
jgi:hypothetical protein